MNRARYACTATEIPQLMLCTECDRFPGDGLNDPRYFNIVREWLDHQWAEADRRRLTGHDRMWFILTTPWRFPFQRVFINGREIAEPRWISELFVGPEGWIVFDAQDPPCSRCGKGFILRLAFGAVQVEGQHSLQFSLT